MGAPSPFPLPPSRGLFVTGTDTGVGKTRVSVMLMESLKRRGYKVAGMKPVAAGLDAAGRNEDVVQLMQAANVDASLDDVCPYRFAPAIAPHVAAETAGTEIRLDRIAAAYQSLAALADWVVVEGAGGFLVPMNPAQGMDSIPVQLGLPVVLVVGMKLGCLNHALLTGEAIRARGLLLAGWVANQIDPEMKAFNENLASLKHRIDAPCLGVVSWMQKETNGAGGGLSVEELVNKNTQR